MSVQKVFEAHLHTVQLANDPFMNKFRKTVIEGKASVSTMLAESAQAGSVDDTRLNKLRVRATNVDANKTSRIMEANVPSKMKMAMLASVICGVNLFEASAKPVKVKRGTTTEYEGDTYRWMGHGWGKFDPDATSKKKQWVPFSGKELKATLTAQAQQEQVAAEKEAKRKAARDEIKQQSSDASYAEFARTGAEWDAKQQADADAYKQDIDQSDAEWEQEQRERAQKYRDLKNVPATVQAEPEQAEAEPENTTEPEMDADFDDEPVSSETSEPEDDYIDAEYTEVADPVADIAKKIQSMGPKQTKIITRLLSTTGPVSNIALQAYLAGNVDEVLDNLTNLG